MQTQTSPSRRHLGRSVSQPDARPGPGIAHSRRFEESWVELSSQPSSSSISSVDDEIVTTGLEVGGPFQRRRRLQPSSRTLAPPQQPAIHVAGASSQEDAEESESESESDEDRLMTSSAENVDLSGKKAVNESQDDSDEGDKATALGRATNAAAAVFRPQPNAFSHPPTALGQRSYSTGGSAGQDHPHSSFRRLTYPNRSQTREYGGAPNFMHPSAREENDAALRASLTTLLSCAAAARRLSKSKEETDGQGATPTGVVPSSQPMGLRFVSESDLDGHDQDGQQQQQQQQQAESAAAASRRKRWPSTLGTTSPKTKKRSESAGRKALPRSAKKKRVATTTSSSNSSSNLGQEDALISPTLLSWVVSAGVVVLVSVVGFGAGYVIGREVSREEASRALTSGMGNETASAGTQVICTSAGLRKLRWDAVGRSMVAQA